jgi:hypothetical protein
MLVLLVSLAPIAARICLSPISFPAEEIHSRFGCSVAGLGDVDGNGREDLVFGTR